MKLEVFEKCIKLLNSWFDKDETGIIVLYKPNMKNIELFGISFKNELTFNLLEKQTNESKQDLIKYYILQLWDLHRDYINNKIMKNYAIEKGEPIYWYIETPNTSETVLSELWDAYLSAANFYFYFLVQELQRTGQIYGCNLAQICDELGIYKDLTSVIQETDLEDISLSSLKLFDKATITDIHERSKSESDLTQNELDLANKSETQCNKNPVTQKTLRKNPKFKKNMIPTIMDILGIFFSEEQLPQLNNVITTGDLPSTKLLFYGNGKTLLDFFKQLMKGQFLNISVQSDLEYWISCGFEYWHNNKKNEIKHKYASRIISGTERAAPGNQLIDIVKENGEFKILKLEIQSRKKS